MAEQEFAENYARVYAFIAEALDTERPIRVAELLDTIKDVAYSIDRIVRRNGHPDDALHARAAMQCLIELWVDTEEAERIWLGEAVVDTTGDSDG